MSVPLSPAMNQTCLILQCAEGYQHCAGHNKVAQAWMSICREELKKNIDDFLKKVTGKMDASVNKVNSTVKDTLNK